MVADGTNGEIDERTKGLLVLGWGCAMAGENGDKLLLGEINERTKQLDARLKELKEWLVEKHGKFDDRHAEHDRRISTIEDERTEERGRNKAYAIVGGAIVTGLGVLGGFASQFFHFFGR